MAGRIRKYSVIIVVSIVLALAFVWWYQSRGYDDSALDGLPSYSGVDQQSILAAGKIGSMLEPSYNEYYAAAAQAGAEDSSGAYIPVAGGAYAAASDDAERRAGVGGRAAQAVILPGEGSWVEYEIEVPSDGFYQLGMDYYALEGKGASLQSSVRIDGAFPFFQAKRMVFQRMWAEAGDVRADELGNEFNPRQQEVSGWQFREFRDPAARVAEPFRFYMSAGKHTVRIEMIREPVAIGELRVYSPPHIPAYEQLAAQYKASGYKETSGFMLRIQAEQAALKSDPTLRRLENREPATEPFNRGTITLNTIGGESWRDGSQWLEWEFSVPESGLYNIGTRFNAKWMNHVPVQRTVTIDGLLPFEEMNAVNFPFSMNWRVEGLGSSEEETPYLYYLEEGVHRIRMEVQVGELGSVFETIQSVTQRMSLLGREILLVTGTNPDPNREWELERNVPNLTPRLHLMAIDLDNAIQAMYDIGIAKGSARLAPIAMARDQLLDMASDTASIPRRLDSFSNTQSTLGTWINSLSKQRLQLDYIVVKSPDVQWSRATAGFWTKLGNGVYDFFSSFTTNYSQIGSAAGGEEKSLDVWVARGRDWVQIIKQMADDDFTAQTGVKINVNIIPAQAMNLLMLASTSGNAPDVALGVEANIPIDFALRNAVVDLGEFPDFQQVADRFRPGALIPYKYQGGHYALPENQNFNMMFYRKDIMQELGVTDIPQTWEEVMALIPLLQQNGMDFYYPHDTVGSVAQFAPFLFQSGGDFYRNGGRESHLDTPEALNAMKMWTGLYTNYKISKEANFYNRFRTGEMPIGVADYQTYVLLTTAAPELTGWWGMLPMPGIRQPDGAINRSVGGAAQTAVIFKDTEVKDDAWEFVKWWTSAPVQEQFGSELEALMGAEARWNTANVEALTNLPWPSSDIASILEQWEWFTEREIVPGDYYTSRYINNIWNEIVLNGKSVREALEEGVKEINREIRKKREEFGLDEEQRLSAPAGTAAEGGDAR